MMRLGRSYWDGVAQLVMTPHMSAHLLTHRNHRFVGRWDPDGSGGSRGAAPPESAGPAPRRARTNSAAPGAADPEERHADARDARPGLDARARVLADREAAEVFGRSDCVADAAEEAPVFFNTAECVEVMRPCVEVAWRL